MVLSMVFSIVSFVRSFFLREMFWLCINHWLYVFFIIFNFKFGNHKTKKKDLLEIIFVFGFSGWWNVKKRKRNCISFLYLFLWFFLFILKSLYIFGLIYVFLLNYYLLTKFCTKLKLYYVFSLNYLSFQLLYYLILIKLILVKYLF